MFAVGRDEVLGWVEAALYTEDEVVDVLGCVIWILSGRFLTTTPSRIFERIDIWRKVIQTGPTSVVERTRLFAYDGGNLMDELIVKGGRSKYGFWEGGCRAEVARSAKVQTRAQSNAMLMKVN